MAYKKLTWNKDKNLIMAVFLIAALAFVHYGYLNSHQKYAGQQVFPGCGGGVFPASSLANVGGGGPCIAGQAYVETNNYRLYYFSLFTLIDVVVAESLILAHDFRRNH